LRRSASGTGCGSRGPRSAPGGGTPLLRHPATAILATLAAAVFALASGVSPAGAALRHASNAFSPHWPGAVEVLGAGCLLAVT
jgi:hypothetical protein